MHLPLRSTLAGLAPLIAAPLLAQLTVSPQTDLQIMAETLAGNGVRIENVSVNCHNLGYGEFNYSGNTLGASEGVLLTTGRISYAVGPNNVENRTYQQQTAGDPLLNIVTSRTTYDACKLEFDLIPSGDSIAFDFVFASEEYNEWVGSQYNDVFGFFISGPGIVGDPGIGADKNIALLPNSSQAVTINNVNNGSNNQYYYDNAGGSHIQYDGFTTGLRAISQVQPCETYHLKLVIADASDRQFDSGVFIQKIKSNNITMQSFTALGIPELVEGCNAGVVRFERPNADPDPLDLQYFIQGTATNGTDYSAIGDLSPMDPKSVTIPAGATYVDVAVDPVADGILEGSEYLRFILGNPVCPTAMSDSIDVFIVDSLPASILPADTIICDGSSVQLAATGGTSYAWSPAATLNNAAIADPIASPATTTTYTVQVSNGDCSRSLSTSITISDITLTANIVAPLCNGQTNGAIDLSVQNGIAPYGYSWIGPNGFTSNSQDLANIGSGTYTVTVTDAIGCSQVQSFNVNAPAPLDAFASATTLIYGQNIACNGASTGNIDLTVNGGTAPYAVVWSGPNGFSAFTQDLNGIPAGTYTASITDQNGCNTTVVRTLTEPPAMSASVQDLVHVDCHGGSTGSATAAISGGMPPFTYTWSNGQNIAIASGLPAGTHTVTITDGYGCAQSAQAVILQPASPLSVSVIDIGDVIECQNGNIQQGSATAVVSGGTGPYTYEWNTAPIQDQATAIFNSDGNFDVTVTDASGCIVVDDATIDAPGVSEIVLVDQTNVACFGASNGEATIALSGSSSVTSIAWNTSPAQSGLSITGLTAGTYTAIAQHANGCESTTSVTITEPDGTIGIPQLSAVTIGNITCHGDSDGSIELDITGGTAPYSIEHEGTPVGGTSITGLAYGDHQFNVSDVNGCGSTTTFTVGGPAQPLSVGITGFTNVLCTGSAQGNATAAASGGTGPYTYSWDSDPVQTGTDATELIQGTYTVTATDANGCTATADVTIGGPQFEINALIENIGHVTCFGANDGFASIAASGGSNSFTITWNTTPPITGPIATGLAEGIYEVEVTDNNGCDLPKVVSVEILGPDEPLVHSIEVSDHNGWNISCHGASDGWIDVTVVGGTEPFNYLWTDEFGNIDGMEDPSGLDAGTYFLSISDAFGCTVQDTVELTEPQPLALQIDLSDQGGWNISCAGAADGGADLTITGGTSPYAIQWSNNQGFISNQEDLSGLAAGTYDLSVTDANGCTIDTSITLSAPDAIAASAVLSDHDGYNVSCAKATDGSIDLTVNGGLPPYTFLWDNGATTEDLIGLQAGTYVVIITDANGCEITNSYTLTAPELIVINAFPTVLPGGANTSCPTSADGEITTTIDGGLPPYSIMWNGPGGFTSTDGSIDGLIAGDYFMMLTDANGCTMPATVQLVAPDPITIALTSTTYNGGVNIGCHGASTGNIISSASGGTGELTHAWSGPNGFTGNDPSLSGLSAGQYVVTITDLNGCSIQDSITLIEADELAIDLVVADAGGGFAIGCNGNEGSISVNVNGGTPQHSFSWNGPNGFGSAFADISGLSAGNYQLTVMDANGCTTSGSATLSAPPPITATFVANANLCDGGTGGSIGTTIGGGVAGYDLQWNGPDGFTSTSEDLTGLAAGQYDLLVTDALGCTATFTTQVIDPAPLSAGTYVSYYGEYNLQCAGDSTGVIELVPGGGTAPYQVTVAGPAGNLTDQLQLTQLIAGDYLVTITDANGCTMDTTITLTQPVDAIEAALDVSVYPSGTNVSCYGASDGWIETTVNGGAGPYEIFWRGPDSLEWDMQNIYDLPAGNYSYELVVIDANQCTYTTEITLTQPDTAILATDSISQYGNFNVSCAEATDGSIDLSTSGGNGGYSYNWIGPDGFSSTDEDLVNIAGGAYAVSITDINGCVLDRTIIVAAPDPLMVILSSNAIDCFGDATGIIQAEITGGHGNYDHSWSGPLPAEAPLDLADLAAGTYCLTATDAFGCTTQECITINEPDQLTASATASDADCGSATGAIDLSVSGGVLPYQYMWSNGGTIEDPTDLQAGDYSVSISDGNGCMQQLDMTVEGTPAVDASATITGIACNGAAEGAIDLSILSGVAPFDLQWSNGSTSEDLSDLQAGDQSITITDANGCTFNATYTIEENDAIELTADAYTYPNGHHVSHYQGSDGDVQLNIEGGTAPYSILWNDGSTDATLSGASAGTYTVEVTDANGCSAAITVTLTEPTDLEMPTGFTPNGDGANDAFVVRGLDGYGSNTLMVYNRWGNVVYERLNYKNDWTGTNGHGEMLPDGTYFVILTVNKGERTLQGYVDLRR